MTPPAAGERGTMLVAVFVRGLSILSGLIFTSALSFWLTRADYGMVATALSAALVACTFGEFGQRELMAREISCALAHGDGSRARALGFWSLGVVAVTGFASAVAVFILLTLAGFGGVLAALTALITYALCFDGALSGIGRAFGLVFWALAPRDFIWRTAAMLIILSLLAGGFQVGAGVAALVLLLALIGASGLQVVALAPKLGRLPADPGVMLEDRPQLACASADLGIGYVGGVILATLDVVLVGIVLGVNAAAEYYPANRIAILALSLSITLQLLFPAHLARLFALGKLEEVRSASRRGALLSAGCTLVVFAFVLLSRPVLPWFFETATDQTWLIAVILSAGSLANAMCGFAGSILVATGHERILRRITLITIPLTVVLLAGAAGVGGEIAVALAVSTISTLRLLATAVACYKRFGFAGSIFA